LIELKQINKAVVSQNKSVIKNTTFSNFFAINSDKINSDEHEEGNGNLKLMADFPDGTDQHKTVSSEDFAALHF
jgi:hypothetical protein